MSSLGGRSGADSGSGQFKPFTDYSDEPPTKSESSDWGSELTEDTDDRRLKRNAKFDRAATPDGARRSKRFRGGEASHENGDAAAPKEGTPSPDEQGVDGVEEHLDGDVLDIIGSPTGPLRRNVTDQRINDELPLVRSMWEMAAVFDFLYLFRQQLKLRRQFAPDELERVLITSPGDSGLLPEIHMDLLRGISPKSEVTLANWQVNLANKIKFHWKTPSDGSYCPFKPDKYYEAVTYAALSTADRVRALHFLCCIRVDKEDIQTRILEAVTEKIPVVQEAPKQPEPPGAIPAEVQQSDVPRPASNDKDNEEDEVILDTIETFKRQPTGIDSNGAAYYYFDMLETSGFRLYKEVPAATQIILNNTSSEDEDDAIDLTADGEYQLPEGPQKGTWEVVADTLEELEAEGQRLLESTKKADKELGRTILEEFVVQIKEREEAEERKRKAEERVKARLGVLAQEDILPSRSRRERRAVNYTFHAYDDMLRSAIRRSQRGDYDSGAEDGRLRRAASPQKIDDVDAALSGMRRGRSVAVLKAHEKFTNLDERALRKAARNRSESDLLAPNTRRNSSSDKEDTDNAAAAGANGRVDEMTAEQQAIVEQQRALDAEHIQVVASTQPTGARDDVPSWPPGVVPVAPRSTTQRLPNKNVALPLNNENPVARSNGSNGVMALNDPPKPNVATKSRLQKKTSTARVDTDGGSDDDDWKR